MTAPTAEFQAAMTPIEPGVTLLDASAGTGKTYTLSALMLRMLVETPDGEEAPIPIERILVVTYTEAATAELRERIRSRIARALRALELGESDEEIESRWIERWPDDSKERRFARQRLDLALRNFDQAAIFTIHGFCTRVLRERAFESGVPFDEELVADQRELIQAAVDDFWRRHFAGASVLSAALASQSKIAVGDLLDVVAEAVRQPDVEVRPTPTELNLDAVASEISSALDATGKIWTAERAGLRSYFGETAKWANKPYNNDAAMDLCFDAVDRVFGGSPSGSDIGELLQLGQTTLVKNRCKRKGAPAVPVHAFFERCDALGAHIAQWAVAVRRSAVDAVEASLAQTKREQKLQSYDDLLLKVRDALRSPAGARLAGEVRRQFAAALVDEFQDTDPVQWEIFRTLFAGETDGAGPRAYLFLIGDPKQSIYGFRSADVFTYIDAARSADRRYSLRTNWRSERALVHAVNSIFERYADAFVFDGIGFAPVTAAAHADETALTLDGKRPPPLVWWLVESDTDSVVDKGDANERIPNAVAAEIVRLLSGVATLGGVSPAPLKPREIAVLVRKHGEARCVQEALRRAGVASVRVTREGVFQTREARELFNVLSAVASPGDSRLFRGAVLARWVSGDVSDVEEGAGDPIQEQFRRCLEVWENRGIGVALERLMNDRASRSRLMSAPDGERAVTNLLHLARLAHEAEGERGPGVGALVNWLADRITEGGSISDEHLLRLERDDEAVRIVTTHSSKGLEYDVVFCPYCWDGNVPSGRKATAEKKLLSYHDPELQARVLDLGPEHAEECVARRRREEAAENVRLFYVALTRARHRCYVVWGSLKGAETSAPAWLLHRAAGGGADAANWKADFSGLGTEGMRNDLEALVRASVQDGAPTMEIEVLPDGRAAATGTVSDGRSAELEARTFARELRDDWRTLSFSALTADVEDDAHDYDAVARSGPVSEPSGMFAFPGGTRAGVCLHSIFERIDFASGAGDATLHVVEDELRANGIDGVKHRDAVVEMVGRTLRAPLTAGDGAFSLLNLPQSERLTELQFHCPVNASSSDRIAAVLEKHSGELTDRDLPGRIGRARFDVAGGVMTGFMDLVVRHEGKFHIVDWKSNWLGNEYSDYASGPMVKAMAAHLYPLQYLIYTVALDRWLSARMGASYTYDAHFGGVHYLFLRGISPDHPGNGVFEDRPSGPLIRDLGDVLLLGGTEVSR